MNNFIKKVFRFYQKLQRWIICVSYMQSLKNKIDWNLFEKIRNKNMKENYNRIGPLKYFNYKEYLRLNVGRAIDLKFHSCAPEFWMLVAGLGILCLSAII
jgi:hypothetical protein